MGGNQSDFRTDQGGSHNHLKLFKLLILLYPTYINNRSKIDKTDNFCHISVTFLGVDPNRGGSLRYHFNTCNYFGRFSGCDINVEGANIRVLLNL